MHKVQMCGLEEVLPRHGIPKLNFFDIQIRFNLQHCATEILKSV